LAVWESSYTLLAQTLIRIGRDISPSGYRTLGAGGHVVRRLNSVSRFTRSSGRSNPISPSSKRSIRGIRLHRRLRKSRAIDYSNWRNGVPRERGSDTDRSEHAGCQKPTSMPNRGPSSSQTSELPVILPQSLAKLLIRRLALRLVVTDLARLPIRVLPGCQRSIRNYLERLEFLFWTASRRCWIA
jgi:hypothetical protein